jgi:hypothetical protein
VAARVTTCRDRPFVVQRSSLMDDRMTAAGMNMEEGARRQSVGGGSVCPAACEQGVG